MQYYAVSWAIPMAGAVTHTEMSGDGCEEWREDLKGMDIVSAHSTAEAEAVLRAARPAAVKVVATMLTATLGWEVSYPDGMLRYTWGDYTIDHQNILYCRGTHIYPPAEVRASFEEAQDAADKHYRQEREGL